MKRILMLAVMGLAAFASAKPKQLSKAQIEKQDRANWGEVDYEGAMDGENPVKNDYAQIQSMIRGERAKMINLFDICKLVLNGASVLNADPETLLADALKELGRPIDPTPPRTHSNLSATPGQKLGFKSLIGAKNALAKFNKTVRGKMREFLRAEVETKFYSDYNRMARVTTYPPISDGSIVKNFKKIDAAWGKYLKLVEKIGDGTDKWKYRPAQLLDPDQKKKLFGEVLKASGLDCEFNSEGKIYPKESRTLHALDNYLKRVTDADVARLRASYDRCRAAHETADNGTKEFTQWFMENSLSLDPAPRSMVKELSDVHAWYASKSGEMLKECLGVINELNNESKSVYKLRKCKDFSPNKAFFVRSGEVSSRPPAYIRRMNELSLEAKKRFEDAVSKRLKAAGRIQL